MDTPRIRRWAVDGLLAGLLLLSGLSATRFAALNQPASTPLDPLAYALIVLAPAALLARRRWPVATLAVVTGAAATYLVLGYPYGPIMVAFSVAVYNLAAALPLRPAAIVAGLALVAISLHVFVPPDGSPGMDGLVPAAAWIAVPFAIGVTVRAGREASVRAEAERARRIADDERLRIAQEVHDVVGHGLAAINMQAEIALHLLDRQPQQAGTALTAISRTSKDALDELRATLAVVRRGGDRAPAPGLAQLPALRDRLAAAGVPVSLSTADPPSGGELPVAVDLAAYRVVQEALTNVLRHAGRARADVRVEHREDALVVEVTDTGRGDWHAGRAGGAADGGGGTGIAGMRERVGALGGQLLAEPRPGGGFRVHAVIPLHGEAP